MFRRADSKEHVDFTWLGLMLPRCFLRFDVMQCETALKMDFNIVQLRHVGCSFVKDGVSRTAAKVKVWRFDNASVLLPVLPGHFDHPTSQGRVQSLKKRLNHRQTAGTEGANQELQASRDREPWCWKRSGKMLKGHCFSHVLNMFDNFLSTSLWIFGCHFWAVLQVLGPGAGLCRFCRFLV